MAVVPSKRESTGLADCLAADNVGALVRATGAVVSGRYQVETVDPSAVDKMPAVAMIIQKTSPTECVIQFSGIVHGVYSALTPGEQLFVGPGGVLDDEPPDPGVLGGESFVQYIGVSVDEEELSLTPVPMLITRRST